MKEINPGELKNILLEVAFRGGLSVMVWGTPGIGKSRMLGKLQLSSASPCLT